LVASQPLWAAESNPGSDASLVNDLANQPLRQQIPVSMLRHNEAVELDEIMEKLDPELSSSEIFTALFKLELAGRVRQLPGKNYVKSF
jgi:DNA processing protein